MDSNPWVHRRFFLSNQISAPRLFCFNTSAGFHFGEICFDNETVICNFVDRNRSSSQIDHLCWLPETIFRPSQKKLHIALITQPDKTSFQQVTGIYRSDLDQTNQSFHYLDETNHLTPSSIDYNRKFDKLATSHIDGITKIYKPSDDRIVNRMNFNEYGILHKLEWNSFDQQFLLLAHQSRLNIFDSEHDKITLTLTQNGHEHLADCSWKNNDLVIGRHRQNLLVWDRRCSREPIRTEILDQIGQPEKLKFNRNTSTDLLSLYDGRSGKIKIYDWRFSTLHQIESFDDFPSSSLLDYHWSMEKLSIVVATHQGLLHWIDINH